MYKIVLHCVVIVCPVYGREYFVLFESTVCLTTLILFRQLILLNSKFNFPDMITQSNFFFFLNITKNS